MKIPTELSREYFFIRNLECQWSAQLKKQSEPITEKERNEMVELINSKVKLGESPVFDPEIFGGYIIVPYKIEFWQGKEFRIHDRQVFYLDNGLEVVEEKLRQTDPQDYSTYPDFSAFDWKHQMLDS